MTGKPASRSATLWLASAGILLELARLLETGAWRDPRSFAPVVVLAAVGIVRYFRTNEPIQRRRRSATVRPVKVNWPEEPRD